MRLAVTSAPASEPLTLSEAKAHLRVDDTAEDTLITALITSARQVVEQYIERSLVTQTRTVTLDAGECRPGLVLPRGPVQSITSFETYAEDGSLETVSASAYYLAGDRVALSEDPTAAEWPTHDRYIDAALITYVAGYGAASDVPEAVVHAILMTLANLYEHRADIVVGTVTSQLPTTAKALLAPYRNLQIA